MFLGQQPALTHLSVSGSILGIVWELEYLSRQVYQGRQALRGGKGLGSTQQMGFRGQGCPERKG